MPFSSQISPTDASKTGGAPSIPPPLNIPPSRARRQLAARLAKKKAEAVENSDPDATDSVAVETASQLPEEPSEGDIDLGPATEREIREAGGLQITGLRTVGGMSGTASRVSGLFGGSDDGSSSDGELYFDEDEAGRDPTLERAEGEYEDGDEMVGGVGRQSKERRRPSTTEAKERTPLDDGDDEAAELGTAMESKLAISGEGPFADPLEDSSDDDELVEIRPRRTS